MNNQGTTDYRSIIDRYYPEGTPLRDTLIRHSRSVADKALEINKQHSLGLDPAMVEAGAMLHDIGIFLTDAPSIHCHGTEHYIRHGVLGAALLRENGYPEWAARIAERHTGAGLTAQEIEEQHLPLEPHDLLPETTLEKLICYADKFYSKSGAMTEKPLDRVIASLARHGAPTLARFTALHRLFS